MREATEAKTAKYKLSPDGDYWTPMTLTRHPQSGAAKQIGSFTRRR